MKKSFVLPLLLAFASMSSIVSYADGTPRGILPKLDQDSAPQTTDNSDGTTPPGVLYFGGPVLSHVKVIAVFWGDQVDAETQSKIGDFLTAIVGSNYLDWLEIYNTKINAVDGRKGTQQDIGRGTYAGSVTIDPKNKAQALDKADVEIELESEMSAHLLPVPDANTLYMIYFPPGLALTTGGIKSCEAWCADHEGFVSKKYGNVFYAMMPDLGGNCSFGCGSGAQFDNLTAASSHELVEAITDPLCPNIGSNLAFPAGWGSQSQQEIADLCTSQEGSLIYGTDSYVVQAAWDNSANACRGGQFNP